MDSVIGCNLTESIATLPCYGYVMVMVMVMLSYGYVYSAWRSSGRIALLCREAYKLQLNKNGLKTLFVFVWG
jgi:hypothetical protein